MRNVTDTGIVEDTEEKLTFPEVYKIKQIPSKENVHSRIGRVLPVEQADEVIMTVPVYPELSYNYLLIFSGICLGAYVGTYLRILFIGFKVWSVEVCYTILWAQIIGCVIMGFFKHHQTALFDKSNSRFHRVMYVSITSGLCGSITTFSTWQFESQKNFFLQWDTDYFDVRSSYNGGRFFEWIVSLWIGVGIPLLALHLGHQLATMSPISNDNLEAIIKTSVALDATPCASGAGTANDEKERTIQCLLARYGIVPNNPKKEMVLVAAFTVATLLVVITPVSVSPGFGFVTAAGVCGCAGAHLRYLLSPLNGKYKTFPVGTFAANIIGTWLLALFYCISKYAVDFHDIATQSALFGLSVGFCGCLTTISTFVAEIDSLPAKASYRYGIVSTAVGQIGVVLLFSIAARVSVPQHAMMPAPINLCAAYSHMCGTALDYGCPENRTVNEACADMYNPSTYIGVCSCGTFDFTSDRTAELIIDGQMKNVIGSGTTIAAWPVNAKQIRDPSLTLDVCTSFEKSCAYLLDRIDCPKASRFNNACDHLGLLHNVGECSCGDFTVGNTRVQELLIDMTLTKRFDLFPYNGYPTLGTVNMCVAYENTCNSWMNYIQCPQSKRIVSGCVVPSNYSTFEGVCSCGDNYDVSDDRVLELLLDALIRPVYYKLLAVNVDPVSNQTSIDYCASYTVICDEILDKIACPVSLRYNDGCNDNLWDFVGICGCGSMVDVPSTRVAEMVVDATLFETVFNNYTYLSPPLAPMVQTISSNPYLQLVSSLMQPY